MKNIKKVDSSDEKKLLEFQMMKMQEEIQGFAEKKNLFQRNKEKDLTTVRESIENINQRSDVFVGQIEQMQEQIENLSLNFNLARTSRKGFEGLRNKDKEAKELNRIGAQIDQALIFQKEIMEYNAILNDYIQYIENLDKHLMNLELQKKKTKSMNSIYYQNVFYLLLILSLKYS